MRKVWKSAQYGTLTASKFNLLVTAKNLSEKAIKNLRELQQMGVTLIAVPPAHNELTQQGIKATLVDDSTKGVFPYPKTGIASWVTQALVAISPEDRATIKEAGIRVIHGVFTEFEAVTTGRVKGSVTYNIKDVLEKGMEGGRIAMTSAYQLEEVVAYFEANNGQITEELYEAIGVNYAVTTCQVIMQHTTFQMTSLATSLSTSDTVLNKYRKERVTTTA